MSEQNQKDSGNMRDEFKALGDNLKDVLNAMWESEERKRFQEELEAGMRELGTAMESLADDVRRSEAGQKLREGVDDFSERVRSGEVENKAREEIVKALKMLNEELLKVSEKFTKPGDSDE